MKEIAVTFKCKGNNLFGILHQGRRKDPAIIIMHGFMGTKSTPVLLTKAARYFAKADYSVLRFDFRGSGDSEGNFEDQNIETEVEDMNAAIAFVRKKTKARKIGVIGHSKGAMAAIVGASMKSKINVIVTWGCPVSVRDIWSKNLIVRILLGGYVYDLLGFKLTTELIKKDVKWDLRKVVKRINQPLLIVHGNKDTIVPLRHSKELYKAAKEPKEFLIVKGANHFFPREEHFNTLFYSTKKWFDKYLKMK